MEAQPLAPPEATYRINTNKDDGLPPEVIHHHRRHRKYVMCCGCATALVLILVVVFLVLFFAVFTARSPKMTINAVKLEGLDQVNWTNISPNANLTIFADVTVKNPNIATFKFNNATTVLLYDGSFIGVAESPRATVKAGRTLRFNATVDVIVANFLNVPRLQSDYLSGILPLDSYTRIYGKVKIFNLIKRNFVVRTNCTTTVNVTSYAIVEHNCKRRVNM